MSFAELNFNLLCTCQEFLLTYESLNYFLDNMFKELRNFSDTVNVETIDNYLRPNVIKEFIFNDIRVRYYYRLLFSQDNMLSNIENIYKLINVSDQINAYLERRKKYIIDEWEYENNIIDISLRLESKRENFLENDIKNLWQNENIKNIFDLQNKLKLKNYKGNICTTLIFSKKYNVIGDIIPREFILPNEIELKVGKTTLNGIYLQFENSPLGLEKIHISYLENDLHFDLISSFKIDLLENFYPSSLNYIRDVSKFFIKEV